MNVRCLDDYESLCAQITGEICAAVQARPDMLLCIAAGQSSLGVFDGLARHLLCCQFFA